MSSSPGRRSLQVRTRTAQGTLIVDAAGQVDLSSSPKLRAAVLDALNAKEAARVAVNMTEVSYIDSSGVATLVEALQAARSRNCPLVLFGLQKGAREVLELARLDKLFDIRAGEPEALAP